jgi:hypothetical protein
MENISWIILAVILIVVLFLIYLYWTTNNLVIKKIDLNTAVPNISNSKVSGPTNMSYTYSAWVWVNSWNPNTAHAIAFAPSSSNNNPVAPYLVDGKDVDNVIMNNSYDFALYLDKNSPSLYCTVGSNPNDPSNTIVITNNFPLQSWVYVVVCVQNTLVDCYLNGKLITSQQINQNGSTPKTPSFNNIILGGNTWDCQLINFQRSPIVVNPQEVFTAYLSGNGQSVFSSLSNYGVQLDLTQNNTVKSSYTLF